ncbi:MAG: hypothetical protein CVV52_05725 [Spirochaetae bacterium HGW-Spirochaetae-8]|nr:MAG: hypothetical protein CVV52_05725 [Spirochaetae bacterium HGW-Spirochaetae-8]
MKKDKNIYVNNRPEIGQKRSKNHSDTGFIYVIKNPSSNELSICASDVPLKRGTPVIAPCRYGLDYGVVVGSAVAMAKYEPGSTECTAPCLQVEPTGECFDPDEDLVAAADPEPENGELPYLQAGISYDSTPDPGCGGCGGCGGCAERKDVSEQESEVEIEGDVEWIERVATEDDQKRFREYFKMEDDALRLCREKVQKHNLDMKLVTAHYLFGEPKIIFFFTAANRVDFRDLVKDLVSVFRIRIELRQIGVRDESRVLGGLAVCGRDFCCHCVTDKLNPVSIKMAKEQNLSLNSTKISGPCGRLLCCLSYEYDFYFEEKQNFPAEGSRLKVQRDLMKITEVNILSRKISMVGPEGRYLTIPCSAVYYNEENSHWEITKEYLDEFLTN